MKATIFSMMLATAGLCHAGAILETQADSCLDTSAPGTCKGGSGTMTDGGNSQTYAVSAASLYGFLHVSASSTFNVTNGWALALGYVGFYDDVTITSPTHANGTAGTLHLSYYIDGTNTHTGGGNAFLQVIARDYAETDLVNPVVNYVQDFNGASVNGTFAVTAFPFIYGTQFEIYLSMQATAGTITDNGGHGYNNPVVTASGSGSSNFYNTLVVTGMQTDSSDGTFNSTSGQTYTQDGVVPEPATWALVGLAIPVVLWKRRRMRA